MGIQKILQPKLKLIETSLVVATFVFQLADL